MEKVGIVKNRPVYEDKTDQLVYTLYKLTPEEIKIVEDESK